MKMIKEQLDGWSWFHALGPLAIMIALVELLHMKVQHAANLAITANWFWEMADFINYKRKWWCPLLDIRGASWVDYMLGVITVFLWVLFFPSYQLSVYTSFIVFVEFIIVFVLYSVSNWKENR